MLFCINSNYMYMYFEIQQYTFMANSSQIYFIKKNIHTVVGSKIHRDYLAEGTLYKQGLGIMRRFKYRSRSESYLYIKLL